VFLQSDVLQVSEAMRNAFEQHAGDAFQLSPLHNPGAVFFTDSSTQQAEGQEGQEQQQEESATQGSSAASGDVLHQAPASSSDDSLQEQQQGGSSDSAAAGQPPKLQPSRQWVYQPAGQDTEDFQSQWSAGGWLADNPVGVPTEREFSVTSLGDPVFRVLLEKK
jgi:hypothetical protein